MPRTIQEPEITTKTSNGGTVETTYTHPAYGQIGASRVQGGNTPLYGSEFTHNGFITIRIHHSVMRRDLSRDSHFAHDEFVEVAMSEAQWATFVSSLNVGSGVPCTIRVEGSKYVPGLPQPENRVDQFTDELKETMKDAILSLKASIDAIDAMGMPKGKAAILKAGLEKSLQELVSNAPFVVDQFTRHAETTVESAKSEIHGHMVGLIQRSGLEHLGGTLPLQIDVKGDRVSDVALPLIAPVVIAFRDL